MHAHMHTQEATLSQELRTNAKSNTVQTKLKLNILATLQANSAHGVVAICTKCVMGA